MILLLYPTTTRIATVDSFIPTVAQLLNRNSHDEPTMIVS
jgi:hypothetical protein